MQKAANFAVFGHVAPEIERLAAWVLRDPELVEIGVRRSPAETVTTRFIRCC
jgi:hypothetical protein